MRFLSKVSVLPPVDAVVDTTPYSRGSWRRSCTEASSFHQSDFFSMFWAEEVSIWIPYAAYNEVDQRGSAVTCICLCAPLYRDRQSQTAQQDFPTAGLRFVPNAWIVPSGKKTLLTQKHLYFDIKQNGLIQKQNKKYIKKPKKGLVDLSFNPLKITGIDYKYSWLCFTSKTN